MKKVKKYKVYLCISVLLISTFLSTFSTYAVSDKKILEKIKVNFLSDPSESEDSIYENIKSDAIDFNTKKPDNCLKQQDNTVLAFDKKIMIIVT